MVNQCQTYRLSKKELLAMVMIAFQRQFVQVALISFAVRLSLPIVEMAFNWKMQNALPEELQHLRIGVEADAGIVIPSRPSRHVHQHRRP
jgi:hypothetical protein